MAPQSIPVGLLVTAPVPVPALVTVRLKPCTVKVAVTLCACVKLTVQLPVPLQPAPLQPVKVEPAVGVAVRLTFVLEVKLALQALPQSIPVGLLVTAPVPVPALVTVRVKFCRANVAVTLCT